MRNQTEPTTIPWEGPRPLQVDLGDEHSIILDVEGGLWEAGRSRSMFDSFKSFKRASELPTIVAIAAGNQQNAAVDSSGGLWVWTSRKDVSWASSTPKQVTGLPPLLKVACGDNFLVAEAEEGSIWVLGDNADGQLGLGHSNFTVQPTSLPSQFCSMPLRCLAASRYSVNLVDASGTSWTAGANYKGQTGRLGDHNIFQPIEGIPPLVNVSCGYHHTLALDEDGNVWVWGLGNEGQLGTHSGERHVNRPVSIDVLKGTSGLVAGGFHSLAFHPDGLMVFGRNCSGQLAIIGNPKQQLTPTLSSLKEVQPHLQRSKQKSARSS